MNLSRLKSQLEVALHQHKALEEELERSRAEADQQVGNHLAIIAMMMAIMMTIAMAIAMAILMVMIVILILIWMAMIVILMPMMAIMMSMARKMRTMVQVSSVYNLFSTHIANN